ncbi:hypothetical protein [Roseivivax sediminis]|uniref:Uncharacterized protein n=1 Tax=Roseivivax sediminis TaxID=936889 RepID=A0A1I1YEC1_9RHOB|nr:hypothetical protein [Roseivivax sediminis]SFE17749.1 hypothetical protein SAMN04515678_1073 [Roseivivax sediminis]
MKVITLIQAAALVVLTVLGAYAASDGAVTGADPACFTEEEGRCARPSHGG